MIALHTQDPDIIDAVFQESDLYRPKAWAKRGHDTIQKALLTPKQVKRTPSFIIKVERNNKFVEKVSAPLLAEWMRKNFPYHLAMDEVNGSVLMFRYVDGVYQELTDRLFKAAIVQPIRNYNLELVNMRVVNEVYQILISDLNYIPLEAFNNDENIINFKNGILHLDTMKLTPHSPDYLTTIQLPCEWTGQASETPVFDAFLDKLTSNDAEVQQMLIEYMGLCLSNMSGAHLKKALFLFGPGNTGKSQLLSLTQRLLGSRNYFAIDLKGIEARFGTSYIYGKRLIGSADMGFMSVGEMRTFKLLTGGDNVMAERKGQQAFCFKYHGFMWFATNALPKFASDRSKHTYDRFVIVPCNNVIPKEEQDPNLEDKMYAERNGIIYKAVMAFKTFMNNGFKLSEPQAVIEARQEYKKMNSPVGAFFEECMVRAGNNRNEIITVTAVHKAFTQWCRGNNNNYSISNKEFQHELAEYLGVDASMMTTRASKGIIYKDYTLSADAEVLYL
jgi:P4 family phage/plasmid primase-like protien